MKSLLWREEIVQTLGVKSRGLITLKREKLSPPGIDLVYVDLGTSEPRPEGEISSSGAWLKNVHSSADGGGFPDDESLGGWRAKLLEVDLGLVAAGLKGKTCLLREKPGDGFGRTADVQAKVAQVDDKARLNRIVDVARVTG